MKLIFETCQPRNDVLAGDLKEEMFAAHLRDVIDAKADPIYRDPAAFFEHTYPTEGLKSLLNEALGRLSSLRGEVHLGCHNLDFCCLAINPSRLL